MTIAVAYHFPTIPEVKHQDFPTPASGRPFTAVTLTDDAGTEHQIFLPLGTHVTISAKEEA
jgi:hypothetical protein